MLGIISQKIYKKWWEILSIFMSAIYISMAIFLYQKNGAYVDTSVAKYPPTMYYLSYATMCIGVLWLLRHKIMSILDYVPHIKQFVIFMGQHTMWIYLWHILVLTLVWNLVDMCSSVVSIIHIPFWLARFLIVAGLSILFTAVQSYFAKRIVNIISNQRMAKCIKKVLIG